MIIKRIAAAIAACAPANVAAAQAKDAYVLVPAAERLSFGRVFADASPAVQGAMTLMSLGAAGALVIWVTSLHNARSGQARARASGLGWLKIIRSAGARLGFLTASYILVSGFIGAANVRPAPDLTVLAPGLAEASLAVMLGLLASTIAVICERHLEASAARCAVA